MQPGPRARRHVEAGGDLVALARDRSTSPDLLEVVEGERRPEPEFEWRAHP
ncbi:hypothetical protein [Kineococcus sp. NUM-3379]